LPDTPSPLVSDKPTVPAVIVLFASVDPLVLATKPLPSALNVDIAPVKPTAIFDCAPLSVKVNPDPTEKNRLLAKEGSLFTVMKVWVNEGPEVIAPVVVCTVTPFCTIGTASVPVRVPAAGNWVICTFAMF